MSTGNANLTSFDFALKEVYKGGRVENIIYKKHPLFAMLTKWTKFTGDQLVVPIRHGNPQGISNDFPTAQTNRTTSKGKKFILTRGKKYGVSRLDGETVEAASDDVGSFLRLMVPEVDGTLQEVGHGISRSLFGDGSGQIGRISSGQGTATITLTNKADVHHFEIDMTLRVSAQSDGTSIRTGDVVVTAIDRDAGTVTAA